MPGANCSIEGCGTCRVARYRGIGLFKLPKVRDEDDHITREWRKDLLEVVTMGRVVDQRLQKQIEEDRIHICERHFEADQIYVYSSKKLLKEGAIPSLFLPTTAEPGAQDSNHITKRDAQFIASSLSLDWTGIKQ